VQVVVQKLSVRHIGNLEEQLLSHFLTLLSDHN
jgi:hypothetical protein